MNQKSKDTISIRQLAPSMLGQWKRIPQLIGSGLSIAMLFDNLPYSLGKISERNAKMYPDVPALCYEERSISYRQLNEEANRYANYLKDAGVRRGDVVILMLENRPEALILTTALAKLGAIASLINPQQRGQVLLHSIKLKFGRHFLVGEELIDAFEEIRDEIESDAAGLKFYGIVDRAERTFPDRYVNLQAAVASADPSNPPETQDIRTKEHVAYIFTSGTTGMPKASIQTHKKWLRCLHWFGKINLSLKQGDVMYAPLPFFHANVFLIAWPTVFAYGATLVMKRKFSVRDFWSDIRKYDATAFIYIGEVCRYLLNAPPDGQDRDHRICKVIGNGLRPDIWEEFKSRFGIEQIYEFYGASDSNIIFTNTLNVDKTVGWSPVDFAIVKYDVEEDEPVRNKKGRCIRVKKGETGLMLSKITERFPFDGYVSKKSNESKIFRDVFKKGDTWFNSGDLMRDLGFKHTQFVDRVGDTFRWKGENVATAEVEQVINALPFVDSCSVYGVEIPGCDGRAGMAAIIANRKTGSDELQELAAGICDKLPSYAAPKFIRFVEDFEITETHKIKKNRLKEESFDVTAVPDPLFVLLPGSETYQQMDVKLFEKIRGCEFSF